MIIRVPLLLQRSIAVVHRLNISATRLHNPDGEDVYGYDETLKETITYDRAVEGAVDSRRESSEVRIPCQIETWRYEELRQVGLGDAPVTNMVFVFHREDLEKLGLLDSEKTILLKKGDRISHLEKYGAVSGMVTKRFNDPGLYIYELRPGSWGFGPDGYDLEIVFTARRQEGAT